MNKFKVGDRVVHKEYGAGFINEFSDSGVSILVVFDIENQKFHHRAGEEYENRCWWCNEEELEFEMPRMGVGLVDTITPVLKECIARTLIDEFEEKEEETDNSCKICGVNNNIGYNDCCTVEFMGLDVEDPVKHPKHYTIFQTEAIDIIKSALTKEEYRGYLKGNILKYRLRAGWKNDRMEDLNKSNQYQDWLEKLNNGQ